jgi:hypothetical protein
MDRPDALAPLDRIWSVLALADERPPPGSPRIRDAGRADYCTRAAGEHLARADAALARMAVARAEYDAAQAAGREALDAANAWLTCAEELTRRASRSPLFPPRSRVQTAATHRPPTLGHETRDPGNPRAE